MDSARPDSARMDSARNRLQSVRDQLEQTQNDLKETLDIRAELEASGDTEFLDEVKGTEARQKALVAELQSELEKMQRQASGSESMRARLAAMRDREAQARSVLSGELPTDLPAPGTTVQLPTSAPLVPTLPPVSNAPAAGSTSGLLSPGGSLTAGLSAPSGAGPGAKALPKKPVTSQQEDKLIGEFANLGNGHSAASTGSFGSGTFGTSAAVDKRPFSLTSAPSAASQVSATTSIVNNPPKSISDFSLDSFGENAFGGPPSSKSTIKSSPSSPHHTNPSAPDSAFRQSEGSGSVKSIPKDDFGFGESSFTSNTASGFEPPTFKQWGGNQQPQAGQTQPPSGPKGQQAALLDQGRGVSLKDSFPTTQAPKPNPAGSSSQWQAFDLSPPKPAGSQSGQGSKIQGASSGGFPGTAAFPSQPFPGGGFPGQPGAAAGPSAGIEAASSGGFGGSDFGSGSFPTPAQRSSPAPKSGNPFMDADESADTQQESPYMNPAAYSWGGSAASGRRSTDSVSDYSTAGQAGLGGFGAGPKPSQPAPFAGNPGPAQQSQGFGNFQESLGVPRSSVDYDPFGPLPQAQPNSSRQSQPSGFGFGEDTFPSTFTGPPAGQAAQQAAGGEAHNSRFGHAGQPYLVTPSTVVIPDSDWDAAFSQPKAQAPAQQTAAPEVEEPLDLSVWTPMQEQDREKVRTAYENRYEGQKTGGIDRDAARELYSRGTLKEPFERIFSLADLDGDSRLNYPEFLIYMHALRLLNSKKDAVNLPNRFTNKSAYSIIGVDYDSLPKLAGDEAGFYNDDLGFSPPSRPEPTAQASASESPDEKVKALISRGSNEEDAKRALFLNGDDLEAAQDWLESRKANPDPGNIPGTLSAMADESQPSTSTPEGPAGPRVSLRIDKAILNYKKPVEKPCFAITVVNSWGEPIGEPLQTPPGNYDSNSGTVTFGHTLVLPQGIHKIADDACIYFELKQFKVKEKKWSTMGWTYRHKQNFVKVVDGVKCVRTEAQGLNLYEKPINLSSHFKQSAMRKMRPLSATSPDFYLRVAEAP